MKKICFHINIYKKKGFHTYIKNPRQIPTAISHGKFLRQILMENSCDKFSQQIVTAIPAANNHGKFSKQTPTTNPQIYNTEDGVE